MGVTRPVQTSLIEGMERPVGPIPASVFVGTNSELMKAIAPLYLTGSVLDVTYGEGKWWDLFKPEPFAAHDLYKLDGVDFQDLPEVDNQCETVTFDPPYVLSGGASTARLGPDFQHRYGIGIPNVRKSASGALESLILAGLSESCRVASDWVLVKCMEYAQGPHAGGNDFHDIPTLVTNAATELGWWKHDQIVHFTGTGPGGHNIFDIRRARRAHSYLLVFRPGKRKAS